LTCRALGGSGTSVFTGAGVTMGHINTLSVAADLAQGAVQPVGTRLFELDAQRFQTSAAEVLIEKVHADNVPILRITL